MLKGRLGLATLACVGLAIAISTTRQRHGIAAPCKPLRYCHRAHRWWRVSRLVKTAMSTLQRSIWQGPERTLTSIGLRPSGSSTESLPSNNYGFVACDAGLAFHPGTDALLVIDFVNAQVLSVHPETGQASPCITLPPGISFPQAGLNALTFDAAGNIYISDSFGGIIWRRTVTTGSSFCGQVDNQPWAGPDPLLLPSNGVPGFGANGIEFNKKGEAMFVANTAMDWIVKIPVTNGSSGAMPSGQLELFTNSINGADGIAIDSNDNIWVAANQADEIVVVDPTGKAIAKLGDFDGVQGGVTNGLLFPASPAFSKDGNWLYVTNLELDLRTIGGPQTVDSQWAAR